MNVERILAELKSETEKLDQAIDGLKHLNVSRWKPARSGPHKRPAASPGEDVRPPLLRPWRLDVLSARGPRSCGQFPTAARWLAAKRRHSAGGQSRCAWLPSCGRLHLAHQIQGDTVPRPHRVMQLVSRRPLPLPRRILWW